MLEQSINLLEFNIQQAESLLSELNTKTSRQALETKLANLKDALSEHIIMLKADYDKYLTENQASYISHHAETVIDYAELIVDDITYYFDIRRHLRSQSRKKMPNSMCFKLGKRTITVKLTKS